MIVFGSAASRQTYSFSDVDVAVVFDGFERIPWGKRIEDLRQLCGRGSPGLCYPSVLRAVKEGRPALDVMKENNIDQGTH
jgi:hypothetical protein